MKKPMGRLGSGPKIPRTLRHAERAAPPRRCVLATAVAAAFTWPGLALALPTGAQVVSGTVGIQQQGLHMDLNQLSQKAIVNWQSFGVGLGEQLRLFQPSANAALLARVVGANLSQIHGSIEATGRLYLINPNGVLIGPEGRIDTAGFTASTRNLRDADFLADGGLNFSGSGLGGVTNLGLITARDGHVLLVGHQVRNAGRISAPQGSASLIAADEVFLASADAPGVLVRASDAPYSNGVGVENSGVIEAAQARLQAAGGDLYQLAVNQSGVIRATGATTLNGRIVLTADGGTVAQSGVLTAQQADGAGGEILVGGDYQGRGDTPRATRTVVGEAAVLDASATASNASGGKVVVWADGHTEFAGTIRARAGTAGGDGGSVEVSGKRMLQFAASGTVDTSAPSGKTGTLLLDPDEIIIASGGTDTDFSGSVVTMNATTLGGLLDSNNVVLDTSTFNATLGSGNITIDEALAWTSGSRLTLKSGNGIYINANISAPDGALDLRTGQDGFFPEQAGAPDMFTATVIESGVNVSVDTLIVGQNSDAAPTGMVFIAAPFQGTSLLVDGTLSATTLELDLASGDVGVIAINDNHIGSIRTVGDGNIGLLNINDASGGLNLKLVSQDTGYMRITTPGNLTLEAGSQLGYTFDTDAILASTGGSFINQAGADVFTGPHRFLIYSNSLAGTTKGGLVGDEEFSRTFAGNPPENYDGDRVSRFLFSSPSVIPDLTYTADSKVKLYGDANPALTYSVTGLLPDDELDAVTTGDPLLSTSATINSGVGEYAINIEQGTLASPTYSFTFVPGKLNVNPAPLTIDIDNALRLYGDNNPLFSAQLTGLKAGDSAPAIMSAWTLESSATRESNIGSYAITASPNAASPNYSYTVNNGTLTVNPAPVTISLAPTARPYGDANYNFMGLAVGEGLKNFQSVSEAFPGASLSTTATQASSVGIYPVTASGFANPNYTVTLGEIGSMTINKVPLLITANNAQRFYGDADPAFSVASMVGLRLSDTSDVVSNLQIVSNTLGTTTVGDYPLSVSGTATNYDVVNGGGTLTINKASLNVRLQAASRIYGDPDPVFQVVYEGLKNGETSMPGLSPVSNTNQFTPVGNYLITPGGVTTATNYTPTFFAASYTIGPRPLTVSTGAATRLYGQPNPAFSVSVSGATSWDETQASNYWIAGTSANDRSSVGTYAITPTPNPFGDRFDNLGNYSVSLLPSSLTIERAPISILVSPNSVVWGNQLAPFSYSVVNGLMPWDTAADATGVGLTTEAGGLTPPGSYPISITQPNAGANYTASLFAPQSVTVEKRPLFIKTDYNTTYEALRQLYPGSMDPYFITTYDGGIEINTLQSGPLPGGPNFVVLGSTDGTAGPNFMTYATESFLSPAPGYTDDDVHRFYNPVSRTGVATVSSFGGSQTINTSFKISNTDTITLDRTQTITVNMRHASSGPPGMRELIGDLFPTDNLFADELRRFTSSPEFSLLGPAERQLLVDALANERVWKWYNDTIADTEVWIAKVKAERPPNWEVMVSLAEADIVGWRAEMAKFPSIEALRQRVVAGDELAARAVLPILSSSLMRSVKNGTAQPDTLAALMATVNDQRSKMVASADQKFEAAMRAHASTGLVTALSGPSIPDIVGQAVIEVSQEKRIETERAGGVIGAVLGGGAVMGATLAVVNLVGHQGSALSLLGNVGAMGAMAGPAVIVAVALAIGVTEAVQVAESNANYQRYVAFKNNNSQLTSLSGFDLTNKDNAMQMSTAITALLAQSFSKAAP